MRHYYYPLLYPNGIVIIERPQRSEAVESIAALQRAALRRKQSLPLTKRLTAMRR